MNPCLFPVWIQFVRSYSALEANEERTMSEQRANKLQSCFLLFFKSLMCSELIFSF